MAKKPFDRRSGTLKDAKGKVLRKPKDNSDQTANFKWWTIGETERPASIAATVKFLFKQQTARIEQLNINTRLIGSTASYSLMGTAFSRTSGGSSNPSNQRISFNVCQSVLDTLESKMAKNKVVPTYVTNGAVWDDQLKAKQLTKFTQGLFYQEHVHEKAVEAFNDGGTWGDGFAHIFRLGDEVCIERTLPHEIVVDEVESMVTEPTQLHRTRIVDRDVALANWPELKEYIDKVAQPSYQEIGGAPTAADLITVIESWHLPSGEAADDGMHVITIGEGSLSEEYNKNYFPFAHFRYAKRKLGWYGQGVCERLQNLQGEINRCMILKQRSLWMQGSFKVLVENGSKIVTQHLNNEVGTIIHYVNTPPQYVTPPATNPELQQWIDSLIQKAYDQEGVSKLSTTGEVPMGVESGKAMRTLNQIGDDRFLYMSQKMEEFILEIARQAVEVVKDIYKDKKEYKVIFPDTKFVETIDWKDIDLDEDEYFLKAFPTSSLSDDLTGRLAEVQELTQAGFIDQDTSQDLMAMPDIEMQQAIANSPRDLLKKKLEEMLFKGKDFSPEPFNNLVLAEKLALQYYNYAQLMNAPKDKLALVQNFLVKIGDLKPPPPMPGAGGAPLAAPQPTPTSNLIPNTAQGAA